MNLGEWETFLMSANIDNEHVYLIVTATDVTVIAFGWWNLLCGRSYEDGEKLGPKYHWWGE